MKEDFKEADLAYERLILERERDSEISWEPQDEQAEHFLLKRNSLKLLDLGPGKTILDFGAGFCHIDEWLVQAHPVRVVAAEYCHDYLTLSAQRRERRAYDGEVGELVYLGCDAETLPLRDNSVDFVIVWNILHHLPDLQVAVRELHRVLRPSGTCLVAEANAHSPVRKLKELYMHKKYGMIERSFYPKDLTGLFDRTGFRVCREDFASVRPGTKHRSTARMALHRLKNSKQLGPYLNEVLLLAEKR